MISGNSIVTKFKLRTVYAENLIRYVRIVKVPKILLEKVLLFEPLYAFNTNNKY